MSKATWKFTQSDLNGILSSKSFKEQKEFLRTLIKQKRLPNLVVIVIRDNKLLIDLRRDLDIQVLIAEIKKYKTCTLEEFIENPQDTFLKGEEGNYTNQFIFSYYAN